MESHSQACEKIAFSNKLFLKNAICSMVQKIRMEFNLVEKLLNYLHEWNKEKIKGLSTKFFV